MLVKRHYLSKKKVKTLRGELSAVYPESLIGKAFSLGPVEEAKTEFGTLFIIGGVPAFVITRDKARIFPALTLLLKLYKEGLRPLPEAFVDMGAVRRIVKGADVMAPGITGYVGEFSKGDTLVVVSEDRGNPIAVGEALVSREEAEGMERGKVIKNLHYIGDRLWKLFMKM